MVNILTAHLLTVDILVIIQLHSPEEDILSPFDSKIVCLSLSININNNTHVHFCYKLISKFHLLYELQSIKYVIFHFKVIIDFISVYI